MDFSWSSMGDGAASFGPDALGDQPIERRTSRLWINKLTGAAAGRLALESPGTRGRAEKSRARWS